MFAVQFDTQGGVSTVAACLVSVFVNFFVGKLLNKIKAFEISLIQIERERAAS